jgi:hypothetical protein
MLKLLSKLVLSYSAKMRGKTNAMLESIMSPSIAKVPVLNKQIKLKLIFYFIEILVQTDIECGDGRLRMNATSTARNS